MLDDLVAVGRLSLLLEWYYEAKCWTSQPLEIGSRAVAFV